MPPPPRPRVRSDAAPRRHAAEARYRTRHVTRENAMPHASTRHSSGLMAALAIGLVGLMPAFAAAQTVVGIANLGPHPSITQTIDGFKEEMARLGYVEGRNTSYHYSDANFTQSLMPQMFTQLSSSRPAAILTITTSVSQTALSAVQDKSIPMVFAMVTDPVKAGLVPNWERGGARFVGASDIQDFDAVLAFGRKLFPNARSFGTLFNPGEVNDVVTTQKLEAAAKAAGLAFKPVSVEAVGDIPQRMQLLRDVGFIYVTGSNLVQSAIPAVSAAANRLKVPILSSETEFVKTGLATANYAVSLKSIGKNAARLMDRVLKGEKPAALPVAKPVPQDYVTSISRGKFKELGLVVPAEFDNCGCFVD
ncbi:MAG: ABC transporter substrate-binding protein [Rubrivivax sp.]